MWILRSADTAEEPPVILRLPAGAIKTLGRAAQADLILDRALVSRLHCRLEAGADAVVVVDLESTNGTFVNDARIGRATLTPGDRLRVGRMELTVGRADS